MDKRTFTAAEIAQYAKDALDNWDFEVELDNGRSQKWVEAQKEALRFDEEYAQSLWCEDGPMELDRAYSDIWDFLYEFSINMANQV